MIRPMLNYHGGKWKAYKKYPEPAHDLIIEPFAGGAGYAHRYADRDVLLVDKNPIVIGVWHYLIGASEDEILALPDLKDGQTIRDLYIPAPAQNLIGFCIGNGTTSPRLRPSSWFHKYAATNAAGFWGRLRRERIAKQLKSIRHWKAICGEYSCVRNIRATWFIDPPYMYRGKNYPCGPSGIDYADLGDWCQSRKGQVVVCEHASGWWLPFENIGESRAVRGYSAEALWIGGVTS